MPNTDILVISGCSSGLDFLYICCKIRMIQSTICAMTIHNLNAQEFTDFVKKDTEELGKLIN